MQKFNTSIALDKRQTTLYQSTCGYDTENANKPRTANPGFDCRYDTSHYLWGFCPTTVIAATDCGLAGNCVDLFACSFGCGLFGTPSITTFYCTQIESPYCVTAFYTDTNTNIFTYLACGEVPGVQHLFAEPITQASAVPSASSSPAAAPASTSTSTSPINTSASSATSNLSPSDLPTLTASIQSSISSTSPFGASSAPSTQSSTIALQNSSTFVPTTSSRPSEIGAIVGGVIGGLAILAFFTLGILFLRRYNKQPRNNNNNETPSRNSRWTTYFTTAMQTTGLHEKKGTARQFGLDGSQQARQPVFELG